MAADRKRCAVGQNRIHRLRVSNLWERTLDSIPDLIAVVDRDHRILRVNEPMAKKLGRTPERCIGLRCHECVHGAKKPPAFCPHTLSLADGKEHAAEVHDDCLGGCFLVTTTPLRDETGRVVGSIHVARDITEQKKDQEILRHLLETSDHERQLISCEIHDGLAQQLASAMMQFEAYRCGKELRPALAAKALNLGIQMVRDGLAEARRLIAGLRPPQLEADGLLAAVRSLVEQCGKRSKVKIELCCTFRTIPPRRDVGEQRLSHRSGVPDQRLPAQQEQAGEG